MRFAWVCLAITLGLAGCETGTGSNELGVCTTACRCFAGLPGQQRACVDECLAVAGFFATRACETCIFENADSCAHMEERCFVDDVCAPPDDPVPEPDPVPPDF
jgi:hypothetical protein